MTPGLRVAYAAEMEKGWQARALGNLDLAFAHFERAHVLGQSFTVPHVRTHLALLVIGCQRKDAREILGQITRMLAAALFTRIWVPVGNTGGANVSALKPMPLPEDLRKLLETETSTESKKVRPRQ